MLNSAFKRYACRFLFAGERRRGGINDRIVNRTSALRAYGPVSGSRAAELLGKDPVLLAKVINELQLELIHWRSAQTGMIENSLDSAASDYFYFASVLNGVGKEWRNGTYPCIEHAM